MCPPHHPTFPLTLAPHIAPSHRTHPTHAPTLHAASIAMVFEPQPTPSAIKAFAALQVTRVACGHNHTIAVASDGCAYTWGNGGYGRCAPRALVRLCISCIRACACVHVHVRVRACVCVWVCMHANR